MVPASIQHDRPELQVRWACAELIRRLRAGDETSSEPLLAQLPEVSADDELAIELIYTEFVTREELGQQPDAEEFLQRYARWEASLRRQLDIHRVLSADSSAPGSEGSSGGNGAVVGGAAPQHLGPFEILGQVGRGGMGVVYKARHEDLGRIVALKMITADPDRAQSVMERLRAEAQRVAALRHPHIVQLDEFGQTDDGRPFLAFEYLAGGSLKQRINGLPQDPRWSAEIVRVLAETMHVVHGLGIIHCDLTPSNVLLTLDDIPKITDFGLARLLRASEEGESAGLEGTPSYMAPEQIDDPRALSPSVDVYALGALLYELLTGRPPYLGATPVDTLQQVRMADLVAPRQLQPELSRDLAVICEKCLNKEPRRRYATAAALARDLTHFLAGEPIAAREINLLERLWKWARRRRSLAAATLLAGLLGLALVVTGVVYNFKLRQALDMTLAQAKEIFRQSQDLQARIEQSRRSLFTMQLAQAESLVDRNPAQAITLLDDPLRSPPDLRDFAWGLFRARCALERQTLRGESGFLAATMIDAETVQGVDALGRVITWKISSGVRQGAIPLPIVQPSLAAWSADGQWLAVVDEQQVIWVWQRDAWTAPPRALRGHQRKINALAWIPDRNELVSAGEDEQARVWNVVDGASLELERDGETLALAAAPSGDFFAAGGTNGIVTVWKLPEWEPFAELPGHIGGATALAFTPDGLSLLAASLWGGRIDTWDLEQQEVVDSIDIAGALVRHLALDAEGVRVAVGLADLSLRLLRRGDSSPPIILRGHAQPIQGLNFSADGHTLLSSSDDQTVRLWDTTRTPPPATVPGDSLKTLAIALSDDSRWIAAAGFDPIIRLYETATQRPIASLDEHAGAIRGLAFTADRTRLISASEDRTARVWDLSSLAGSTAMPAVVGELAHPCWVMDVALDPRQRWIATIGEDGTLRLWNWTSFALEVEASLSNDTLNALAFSPDGKTIALVGRDGRLILWNVDTQRERRSIAAHAGNILDVTFAPNGRYLATSGDDAVVLLWDLNDELSSRPLYGHSQGVYGIAFSADSRSLASGTGAPWASEVGEVKLWDVEMGQVHATLLGYSAPLAFGLDQRTLATTRTADHVVSLWQAWPYRPSMTAERASNISRPKEPAGSKENP